MAATTIKIHDNNNGWRRILHFHSDSHFRLPIIPPDLLTPSRSDLLKSIPSLHHGLVASVDTAALLGMADDEKIGSIPFDHASSSASSFGRLLARKCPGFIADSYAVGGPGEPCCPQASSKHKWGSDLELAAPLLKPHSPASTGRLDSSKTPLRGLDLNLDLSESQEHGHGVIATEAPVRNDTFLNLELGKPLLSSPPSPLSLHLPEESVLSAKSLAALDSPTTNSSSGSSSNTNGGFFSVCIDETKHLQHVIAVPSSTAATSDESIGNNLGRNTMSFGGLSPMDSHPNKLHSQPYRLHTAAQVKQHMVSNNKPMTPSPASSTDHSWREESSITQSWQPCPPAAGEIRSHGTNERITELTLHVLSQYFHMPINQASKELRVGLTVLKKRCREFGIPRWPHRKMKSLESLINNIQDLAKDQGVKSSVRVMNTVKELEEQKKLMEEMPGTELAERTKRLRQACFKANYKKKRLMVASASASATAAAAAASKRRHSPLSLDLNRTLLSSANHFGFL